MRVGQDRMKAYYGQVKSRRDSVIGIAQRHGVDPRDVVYELGELPLYDSGEEAQPDTPAPDQEQDADAQPPPRPAWTVDGDPWPTPEQWARMTPEQRKPFTDWSAMTKRPPEF